MDESAGCSPATTTSRNRHDGCRPNDRGSSSASPMVTRQVAVDEHDETDGAKEEGARP